MKSYQYVVSSIGSYVDEWEMCMVIICANIAKMFWPCLAIKTFLLLELNKSVSPHIYFMADE